MHARASARRTREPRQSLLVPQLAPHLRCDVPSTRPAAVPRFTRRLLPLCASIRKITDPGCATPCRFAAHACSVCSVCAPAPALLWCVCRSPAAHTPRLDRGCCLTCCSLLSVRAVQMPAPDAGSLLRAVSSDASQQPLPPVTATADDLLARVAVAEKAIRALERGTVPSDPQALHALPDMVTCTDVLSAAHTAHTAAAAAAAGVLPSGLQEQPSASAAAVAAAPSGTTRPHAPSAAAAVRARGPSVPFSSTACARCALHSGTEAPTTSTRRYWRPATIRTALTRPCSAVDLV